MGRTKIHFTKGKANYYSRQEDRSCVGREKTRGGQDNIPKDMDTDCNCRAKMQVKMEMNHRTRSA